MRRLRALTRPTGEMTVVNHYLNHLFTKHKFDLVYSLKLMKYISNKRKEYTSLLFLKFSNVTYLQYRISFFHKPKGISLDQIIFLESMVHVKTISQFDTLFLSLCFFCTYVGTIKSILNCRPQ